MDGIVHLHESHGLGELKHTERGGIGGQALNNEFFMDPLLIKLAIGGLAVLGAIGLLFGIGLALAAHKFAVEINPKIEEVKEILAGAQ